MINDLESNLVAKFVQWLQRFAIMLENIQLIRTYVSGHPA